MLETLFPYVLNVHIGTALTIIAILLWVDTYMVRWVRGTIPVLDSQKISRFHILVWICLCIMITTGSLLFYPYKEFLIHETAFQLKMAFVLTLITNSFFIGNVMHLVRGRQYSELTSSLKTRLFVAGTISGAAWLGVLIAATQLAL